MPAPRTNMNMYLTEETVFLKKNTEYILSYWYYNKGELRNQGSCILEECDKDGQVCKWDVLSSRGAKHENSRRLDPGGKSSSGLAATRNKSACSSMEMIIRSRNFMPMTL
jgi:hypothetical protein